MFCEAYNQSLTDAAASGEQLSPALQQHVASCESCRVAFAKEQSLFAAIDAGLRVTTNSEVPATLISRVRVAVRNEPAPQGHNFNFFFWSAGASVAAAVVLALLYLPHKGTTLPADSVQTEFARAVSAGTTQNPSNPMELNPTRTGGVSTLQHKKTAVLAASQNAKPELPEVLVPDEERAAFVQFMARTSRTAKSIPARATPVPNAPQESVEISPVEIASLELKPLDPKEGRQGQF